MMNSIRNSRRGVQNTSAQSGEGVSGSESFNFPEFISDWSRMTVHPKQAMLRKSFALPSLDEYVPVRVRGRRWMHGALHWAHWCSVISLGRKARSWFRMNYRRHTILSPTVFWVKPFNRGRIPKSTFYLALGNRVVSISWWTMDSDW